MPNAHVGGTNLQNFPNIAFRMLPGICREIKMNKSVQAIQRHTTMYFLTKLAEEHLQIRRKRFLKGWLIA